MKQINDFPSAVSPEETGLHEAGEGMLQKEENSGEISWALEDLARELLEIHLMYPKQVSQLAQALNASGEYGVLYYLFHTHETCSAGDLAEIVGLTPGRIANVLKALEKKSLITREKDPEDRRKINVSLTDSGLSYMSSCYKEAAKAYTSLIERIGIEDARHFIRVTKKIFLFSKELSSKCESPE